MKRTLHVWMTVVLTAISGAAYASTSNWYGYARTCLNGENWQHKFNACVEKSDNIV